MKSSGQKPLVSIIIHCYNAETTVEECLSSCYAQTYGNIEIVIVDDCSTDETTSVISNCIAKHPQFRTVFVHNDVNSGVAASRNTGLDAANGDYVMFLDSDDYLDVECCRRLAEMMADGNIQCAACNATRFSSGVSKLHWKKSLHETRVFTGAEYAATLQDVALFDSSWAKCYDLEFLNSHNLRFVSSIPFGEDTLFANLVALKATGIAVCTTYSGYFYRDNPNSCSNTIDTRKRLDSLRQVLCRLHNELKGKNRIVLLRKSKEYLWTIKRGKYSDYSVLLQETIASPLWREVLFPVLKTYGSFKHRLLCRLIAKGFFCILRLW